MAVDNKTSNASLGRSKAGSTRDWNTGATWQTLVCADAAGGSSKTPAGHSVNVRFDSTGCAVVSPRAEGTWTADVGWHRDSATDEIQHTSGNSIGTLPEANAPFALGAEPSPHDAHRRDVLESELIERAAEIAHDIRSPISVAKQIISAVTDQARKSGSLSAGEIELLDIAAMRLVEANKWAEGILVGRSLTQGHPVNICRRFYPAQWRSAIEPLLHSIAARRRITIDWEGWDRSLPRVYLDDSQLTRVVLNLVTNAVHASSYGASLTIRVATENAVSQRLHICVDDGGQGIPHDLMDQLNSESRALHPRTRAAGGGMGLKTAKSLAAAMGGVIRASHRIGGGTTVRLSLPTDNPISMLRSWLVQSAKVGAGQCTDLEVQLFAVGTAGVDEQFCDSQIQQSAGARDFVYRVASDRWLWFTMSVRGSDASSAPRNTALDAALAKLGRAERGRKQQGGCHAKMVYRVKLPQTNEQNDSPLSDVHLAEVTHALASQVDRLTAGRVPSVDDLTGSQPSIMFRSESHDRTRQVRLDMAHTGNVPPALGLGRGSVDQTAHRETDPPQGHSLRRPAMQSPRPTAPTQRTTGVRSASPALALATLESAIATPLPLPAEAATLQENAVLSPSTLAELSQLWQADQAALQDTHRGIRD